MPISITILLVGITHHNSARYMIAQMRIWCQVVFFVDVGQIGGGKKMVVRGTYVFWGSASGCDRQEVLKYPVRMFGEQYATGTHSPSTYSN